MKSRSLIILVLAAILMGAIATCPASLFRSAINTELTGVARLENVEGSIWHGDAVIVFESKQLQYLPKTPVAWRFAPSLLTSGIFAYALKINSSSGKASEISGEIIVGRGLSNLHIRDAKLQAPAAAILPLLSPNLSFAAFTGQLAFSTAEIAITPSPTLVAAKIAGSATLNWRNANSFFLLGSAANEYSIEFDGRGAEGTFMLKTLSGPLAAEGQGARVLEKANPYNAIKFSGRAKLPQALLSRMGNATTWLEQIGRMEGDQLIFNWNGRL